MRQSEALFAHVTSGEDIPPDAAYAGEAATTATTGTDQAVPMASRRREISLDVGVDTVPAR